LCGRLLFRTCWREKTSINAGGGVSARAGEGVSGRGATGKKRYLLAKPNGERELAERKLVYTLDSQEEKIERRKHSFLEDPRAAEPHSDRSATSFCSTAH